jgi:hypothetical protein
VPNALLSVILPVINDIDLLPAILPSLAEAVGITEKTHGSVEVVIVDDASRDSSAAFVAENLHLFSCARLVRLPWLCGLPTAVRAGVCEATGDNIIVLGRGESVDAPYLSSLLDLLEEADAVLSSPLQAAPEEAARGGAHRLVEAGYARLARRLTPTSIRSKHPVFVALRADTAEHLLVSLRRTELAYDLEARVVIEAMGLRLAHLPALATDQLIGTAPTSDPTSGRWELGAGQLLRDVIRAYRRRSRIMDSGGRAPVDVPKSPAEGVGLSKHVGQLSLAASNSLAVEVDGPGVGQPVLIGVSPPVEQRGADI